MNDVVFFNAGMLAYLVASVFFLVGLTTGKKGAAAIGHRLAWAGFIAATIAIIIRWRGSFAVRSGHLPVVNTYESMVFFSWCLVLFYLLMERRFNLRRLGVPVFMLGFLGIAVVTFAPSVSKSVEPLVPALQSYWLTIHVVTCFVGYGAFALSFCASIVYLLRGILAPHLLRRLPAQDDLEELSYQAVMIGFIFLTLGIGTGAVWAERAWGRYWGWDPKETWSLITWFIYAAFLHARVTAGWRGARMAVISVAGFACVLFTYWGVNFLLSGLHAYL